MTTEDLEQKYPKIFDSLIYPIAVGEGWVPLINRLCHYLQFHTDKNDYPQIEAVQVKEKFGGLRFYVNGTYPRAEGAISFAESMSNYTCESCGTMKNIGRTKGWIITLCEECSKLDKYKNRTWEAIK